MKKKKNNEEEEEKKEEEKKKKKKKKKEKNKKKRLSNVSFRPNSLGIVYAKIAARYAQNCEKYLSLKY